MRVDKTTDLDDSVVEDGEAALLISDNKALTTKHRDPNGIMHPTNNNVLPNGSNVANKQSLQQNGGGVLVVKKPREPEEDCEEEEEEDKGAQENGEGEDFVDHLTLSMKGVSIQETATTDLEGRLAGLTVKDKEEEEEDDTRCASLQSQSSIITVDPPSLPHEEEEERNEGAEDLAPRGPTAGKPTSFQPNQDGFNRIAAKSYSSHNIDQYLNQMTPFMPPQAPNTAFMHTQFGQSQLYQPQYDPLGAGVNAKGKRGMEDEEDNPYKYTRPQEEMSFPANQRTTNRGYYTQFSSDLTCGGEVLDTSLSPEQELARSGGMNITYEPQLSITELDSMLETFNQIEKADNSNHGADTDCGYSSENSPHSDNTGSPGTSPKSTFSPMRPPSNMSQDSGIASPLSDDNLSTVVPSPPDLASSQNRKWMPGSEDYMKQQSAMYAYKSPPSNTMYHSPPSVPAYQSPPSVTSYQSPASVTTYQNPPSVPSYANPASVHAYPNPPSVTSAMSPALHHNPPSVTLYQNPPSVTLYQNPPSVPSAMSPYSVAGSDDLSMTSMPSPRTNPYLQNDYMFNARKDELRDALDVIAADLQDKAVPRMSPVQKSIPPAANIPPGNMPPLPGNIPASVAQQKSSRPEKLPIAPLPKQVRATAGLPQQQQAAPIMKGAVPVMVVPNPSGLPPVTTVAAPVTSSQPVLLMNGQSPSVILVVNSPTQQPTTTPTSNKKKPVPIRPRPGPPISDAVPKLAAKTPAKSDMTTPKLESNGVGGAACTVNGVQTVSAAQPNPGPGNHGRAPTEGRQPPQSRMLNIARRLVASMTTSDLQFQDAEGDTYLHVSVCKADGNMVRALLERMSRENLQSMVNTQNHMRQTPLYLAVSSNSPEMVRLLIHFGADVNAFAEHTRADGRTKEMKSALHCAASNGQRYLDTLQALLTAQELNFDLVNSDGHTALHCAILEHGKPDSEGGIVNNLPIIQALIKHGADPNAQGKKSGKTALMYALESRDLTLMEHIVALIDPARLRVFLKTQAFDGSSCQRILESLQRTLDDPHRQRLQACFRIHSRRDAS